MRLEQELNFPRFEKLVFHALQHADQLLRSFFRADTARDTEP